MADLPGRSSLVYVSAAGSTYTQVYGVKELDFGISREADETTDHDSAGWKTSTPGLGSLSLSISGNYDEADSGQDIMRTSIIAGSVIYFKFRPAVGTSYKEAVAQGVITGFKITPGNSGVIPFSAEVQLTGALTWTAQ